MRFLKSTPLLSRVTSESARGEQQGVLNTYQVTCEQAVDVYRGIVDLKTYSSLRLKRRGRLLILKRLDDVLSYWIEPLIRLKLSNKKISEIHGLSAEEQCFLSAKEPELQDFSRYLNRKLHSALEKNNYTRSFSYHQRLLGVTQKRLFNLLRKVFFNKANITGDSGAELYLVLKNLRLTEANGLNNPYVAGMPSMIGLYGFLHRFERQLNEYYPKVSVESFALHCSHYHVIYKNKLPAHSIPEKEMRIKRSGITPECSFDGKFSIVVKLRKHSCTTDDLELELLKQSLPERLWGGSLHPPFLYEETQWAELVYGANSLKQFIALNFFDGSWLTPVKETDYNLASNIEQLKKKSRFSLCLVGYSLLEPVKHREVSSGIHAFCEPLIGLCEKQGSMYVIRAPSHIEKQLFWQFVPITQSCTTLRVGSVSGDNNAPS